MELINILVIEDNPADRELVAEFFAQERVCNRVDYAEDLAHARSQLSGAIHYHLILVDHHLPDGKGFDLLPWLRTHHPNAQLVGMSMYLRLEDIMQAQAQGMALLIEKPLQLQGLRYMVQRLRNMWLGVVSGEAPCLQNSVTEQQARRA